jgi:two-component system sensor histidine kinase RegB
MHDQPVYERLCINASWLIRLRWVAVVGQLLTIVAVYWLLRIPIAITPLLILVFVTAVSNVLLMWWFCARCATARRRSRQLGALGGLTGWTTASEETAAGTRCRTSWFRPAEATAPLTATLGGVMVLDLLNLTALLYFTGGPANPFSLFYLVNLGLAAILLPARWAWLMNALAVGCIAWLFYGHVPVAGLASGQATFQMPGMSELTIAEQGLFVAFVACSSVVVYFTTRLTSELRRRETELFRAEVLRARGEKIEALGTLAAGAAHELATPLSTIAVIAKEVERALDGQEIPAGVREDMAAIRSELERCRTILDRMSAESGQTIGEAISYVTAEQLLRAVVDGNERFSAVQVSHTPRAAAARVRVPLQGLAQAVRGIVQNAIDAGPGDQAVHVKADCDDRQLSITVEDSGCGMTQEVLQRAGEPFFTTKEPGNGMGMGLFLAYSVVERLDGKIEIRSATGQGTTVRVVLPLAGHQES